MLHAGIALAGRHRLVYRVARHLGTEMRAVAGPEALHRRLVEQRLADRPEHHAVECAGGALGHRVEPPDRFQFVAEEVEADRLFHAGREHVDDRSEEHTSELQSLMRISYAVFCLKKKKNHITPTTE